MTFNSRLTTNTIVKIQTLTVTFQHHSKYNNQQRYMAEESNELKLLGKAGDGTVGTTWDMTPPTGQRSSHQL